MAIHQALMQLPISRPNNIWVAYSGGVDSTVLLHAASQVLPGVQAVHVHHGLSPNADQWVERCVQQTKSWQIPLIIKKINGKPAKGDSVEAWAREERRRCFGEVMRVGDVLITAQHADDQAESVLLQLLRGAGPAGLSAMAGFSPFAAGFQWRPFLRFSKTDLMDYAREHSLSWAEDDSNQSLRFNRNFLRHEVVPVLKKRWPQMAQLISRSAENCADQEAIFKVLLDEKLAQATQYDKLNLAGYAPLLQIQLIRRWFGQKTGLHLSRQHGETILKEVWSASPDAHPVFQHEGYLIQRERGPCLTLSKAAYR